MIDPIDYIRRLPGVVKVIPQYDIKTEERSIDIILDGQIKITVINEDLNEIVKIVEDTYNGTT